MNLAMLLDIPASIAPDSPALIDGGQETLASLREAAGRVVGRSQRVRRSSLAGPGASAGRRPGQSPPLTGAAPAALARVEALIAFAESRGHTLLELAISWLLAHPPIASALAAATVILLGRHAEAPWIWRLPFLAGGGLGAAAWVFRRQLTPSGQQPDPRAAPPGELPLRPAFTGAPPAVGRGTVPLAARPEQFLIAVAGGGLVGGRVGWGAGDATAGRTSEAAAHLAAATLGAVLKYREDIDRVRRTGLAAVIGG